MCAEKIDVKYLFKATKEVRVKRVDMNQVSSRGYGDKCAVVSGVENTSYASIHDWF